MKSLSLSLVLLTSAAALGAAETTPVTGPWKLHLSIAGYENDMECTFEQKEKELSGSCKGEQGPVAVTGKVDADKIKFQFKTDYQGDELTLMHDGTIKSETEIAGSVDVQPMGVAGEFTATKSK